MMFTETKDDIIPDIMHCWAWNCIYVKSNGRIPCWCDAGEIYTIVKKNFDKSDFVLDILNSNEMIRMRLKILDQQEYHIKECDRCCCLIKKGKGRNFRYPDGGEDSGIEGLNAHMAAMLNKVWRQKGWKYGSIDRIREIQLEPSFPCNLKCPGCLHGWHESPMNTETKPFIFPFKWFVQMLASIRRHNVILNKIAFVGRGEPTLNKNLPKFITHARKTIPELKMSMDTNATQEFKPEFLQLNWINCSIDGATAESYKKYRLRGDFSSTIKFMKNATKAKTDKSCKIRWKYILFNTNDHEINLAQRMAKDIGVDELNFVITTVGAYDGSIKPSSKFLTIQQIQEYLKEHNIFPNTKVSLS